MDFFHSKFDLLQNFMQCWYNVTHFHKTQQEKCDVLIVNGGASLYKRTQLCVSCTNGFALQSVGSTFY